jgi:hypothetical protein
MSLSSDLYKLILLILTIYQYQPNNGILTEAEKFNHYLTLQFGVLASQCKDDDDYLDKTETLIKEWLNEENLWTMQSSKKH